jgi:hypothetical protein
MEHKLGSGCLEKLMCGRPAYMAKRSEEECGVEHAEVGLGSRAAHQTGEMRWRRERLGRLQQNLGQHSDNRHLDQLGLEAEELAYAAHHSAACGRRSCHCLDHVEEDSVQVEEHRVVMEDIALVVQDIDRWD